MIPTHQRRNHETTDDLLDELEYILVAVDVLADATRDQQETREIYCAIAMLRMAFDKINEIKSARAAEWVGTGGASYCLSDAEKAEAVRA